MKTGELTPRALVIALLFSLCLLTPIALAQGPTRITGRVESGGEPVVNAIITVYAGDLNAPELARVLSNRRGEFNTGDLAITDSISPTLQVSAAGYLTWTQQVGLSTASDLFLTISLIPTPVRLEQLTGQVTDETQAVVDGASVVLSFSDTSLGTRSATTDPEGRFELMDLPPLEGISTTLRVSKAGYRDWSQEVVLSSKGDEVQVPVQLTSLPTAPDPLAVLLLAPAVLGLLGWIAIQVAGRWGKIASGVLVGLYAVGVTIWLASQPGVVAGIQTNRLATAAQIILVALAAAGVTILAILAVLLAVRRLRRLGRPPAGGADPPAAGSGADVGSAQAAHQGELTSQARWYAGYSTLLWAVSLAALLWAYFIIPQDTLGVVRFFHPRIEISLFVPLFAFIGVLVYATASIREHIEDRPDTPAYRKPLMAVGQRVLIAPYIAIIADFVLFKPLLAQFQAFSEGIGMLQAEAFLAFFTGLYVKPILGFLNQLGMTLLTAALRRKYEERQEIAPELVTCLQMSDRLARRLNENEVVTVEHLKELSDTDLEEKARSIGFVDARQLRKWRAVAALYLANRAALTEVLGLSPSQVSKLEAANITSPGQLANLSAAEILRRADIGAVTQVEDVVVKARALVDLDKAFEGTLTPDFLDAVEGQGVQTLEDFDARFAQLKTNLPAHASALDQVKAALDSLKTPTTERFDQLKSAKFRAVARYLESDP